MPKKNGRSGSTSKKTAARRGSGRARSTNGQRVADVMTRDPVGLFETDTIQKAAREMRENDIGDVIVLDDTGGRIKGIVTDRDVVVRAIAEGRDPTRTTLSSICSADLVCVSPDDEVDKAVKLMRDKAIRRMPVVEGDHAVGIISIGDLAQVLNKRSALAEISAAPANT